MRNRFVYFDLGNVLVNFDHEIAVNQLAELAGRSPDAVRTAVFESGLQTRFETGLIDATAFTAEVNQSLATDLQPRDVMKSISAIFEPNPGMTRVFEKLKTAGVPIGILSNTCDAHWDWVTGRKWPVLAGEWFATKILSFQVQCMKPDAGIYEASEQQSGCSGRDIFFTDDRADNIAAAAGRGWTTYQFGSIEGLITELDSWLDSEPHESL